MTPEELDRLAISLRAGDYNLLLGAAVSLGSKNANGIDLPLGGELRDELCDLKGARKSNSLQRVYGLLDESEIATHITERFVGCVPGPALQALPSFIWRRIFTLNIDDALEAAYGQAESYQTPLVRNFRDLYEEVRSNAEVPIIHLHGYARQPAEGYVFSREEYIGIIKSANPWSNILAQSLAVDPFIIMGSSLDEVDLDYFLSMRSQSSARADRGPSILVEPFGDVVTQHECEKRGLVLFPGTAEEFISFLAERVVNRPRPYELVPANDRELFNDDFTTVEVSAFFSDFERVPAAAAVDTHDARFFFGHPPTWSDMTLQYDVSRSSANAIFTEVQKGLDGDSDKKVVFLSEVTGSGKTTIMRRVAFDFARQGVTVISALPNSRLDPGPSAKLINSIAGRCLVVVDNLADQVYALEGILKDLTKNDVVFLVGERAYRRRFVMEALSGFKIKIANLTRLSRNEVTQLISTYQAVGLAGNDALLSGQEKAVRSLQADPIAVACCRLMNNFHPLDRIVDSILKEATAFDRKRYLCAAIAQFCSPGGVRFSIIVQVGGGAGANGQFNANHPLPLGFSEERARTYVVPLNGTLGQRVLEICSERHPNEVFDAYVSLARGLAPWVSRKTIRQRTSEAKVSGRLFDIDQVVNKFLGERSREFFDEVHDEWQWNSRYWEQMALLRLSEAQSLGLESFEARDLLELAVQHGRHATAIERHPLTLTTLAKVILASISIASLYQERLFTEAMSNLRDAISIERGRSRISVQPYVVMFRGFVNLPGSVSAPSIEVAHVRGHINDAKRLFARDREVMEIVDQLEKRLG